MQRYVIVSADRLRFMPSLIENVLGGVFLFLKQTMFYIAMILITTEWELENTFYDENTANFESNI
jgi:hypothetical protein